MKPHIGKKIREAVLRSGMTVTEFASRANCSRRNAYEIFRKQSLDTSLLSKIGSVLGHDFFRYYRQDENPERKNKAAEPDGHRHYRENRIREMLEEIEHLKEVNIRLKRQVRRASSKKSR